MGFYERFIEVFLWGLWRKNTAVFVMRYVQYQFMLSIMTSIFVSNSA